MSTQWGGILVEKKIKYVDITTITEIEIIELIKELEKLPFIRSAEPNYIEHPC